MGTSRLHQVSIHSALGGLSILILHLPWNSVLGNMCFTDTLHGSGVTDNTFWGYDLFIFKFISYDSHDSISAWP